MDVIKADILILGAGGAGLFAALHAYDRHPRLKIVIATKGLIGKGGCSRMVQGGMNVVLNEKDSLENHFLDTLKGGGFINNQALAWTLVSDAPKAVYELEVKVGCFFDRDEDGRIHQKPFAGQSFDRTVHVADLTGIQLISRMTDQIFARNIKVFEETRGLDLLTSKDGHRIVGALLSDIRTGEIFVVNSKVTIVATGGCASMYKISAPSFDKTGDGMAICFRAGAEFVDMEMVQFHPTGLVAGRSRLNGSLLEEGLRGAGARLYNGLGERFMERYDPERLERSTRDRVARSSFIEIMAGRGTVNKGVYLDASHLGAEFVEKKFPGMVERVKDIGKDLAREKVEVTPTAHYQMGGVCIDAQCQTNLKGLLVCGEDAGGVHGANRLGGNGICDSTVYGRRAGDTAALLALEEDLHPYQEAEAEKMRMRWLKPFLRERGENVYEIRSEIENLMWEKAGLVRTRLHLQEAAYHLENLIQKIDEASVADRYLARYNMEWNHIIDVANLITVCRMVVNAAKCREESRGAHYREDFPETDNENWLQNIYQKKGTAFQLELTKKPVLLSHFKRENIEDCFFERVKKKRTYTESCDGSTCL
ncbi:MAG: FAD-binding protein [Desulfobacteraceae bacterium]|nr:MAG: FAD-binding protein [Desulfobacteraceae bacterium]